MKLYTPTGQKIIATKCYKRPRFTSHFGRAWQWGNEMTLDGQAKEWVYEGSYGTMWYFKFRGDWYKVNMNTQYDPWLENMVFTTEKTQCQN